MGLHPHPVSHVIFDVDGLILDTQCIYHAACKQVCRRYGADDLFTPTLEARLAGAQAMDVAKIVTKECRLPLEPVEFRAELDCTVRPLLSDASLKPGAARLISHLSYHSVPIAVATSSRKANATIKMKSHNELFDLFHHTVFGYDDPDVLNGKPSPDIFLVAAKRFSDSPRPESCLVLEDSQNGVDAALAAGMQVVMVPERGTSRTATQVISSLEYFQPERYGLPAF